MAKRSISLDEARSSGCRTYFTGVPCKNGHITERSVRNRECLECAKLKANRYNLSAHGKARTHAYNTSPDVKERVKIRNQRPEVVAARKAYLAEYSKRPDVVVRRKKWNRERRAREHAILGSKVWVWSLHHHAKGRAKKAGVPFDDDAVRSFLESPPTHCPVFGWKFNPGGGKGTPDSPSLDRVKPELGYVRGNLALIAFKANQIKNDATPEQVRAVAEWLERWEVGHE